MKELQDLFNERLKNYFESDAITKKIDEAISKCFDDCIDSSFRFGDLKNSIQDVVKEKIGVSIDSIDLQSYNAVLSKKLNEEMTRFTNDESNQLLSNMLSGLFSEAPKEITLTELINKIVSHHRDDNDDPSDYGDYYHLNFEQPHGLGFSLELKESDEQYSTSLTSLYLMGEDDESLRLAIDFKCDISNPTCLHGINGFLFKLYAAKTKITEVDLFDVDDIDLRKTDADY